MKKIQNSTAYGCYVETLKRLKGIVGVLSLRYEATKYRDITSTEREYCVIVEDGSTLDKYVFHFTHEPSMTEMFDCLNLISKKGEENDWKEQSKTKHHNLKICKSMY